MEYKIIKFDQANAQVVLRLGNGDVFPDVAVDLPVADDGSIPSGKELKDYLEGFVPHDAEKRRQLLNTVGIKNPDAITVHPIGKVIDKKTEAEVARLTRNEMLWESDWTQLPDAPLTDTEKVAWTEYRQALRDLPEQEGFPNNSVFPAAPNAPLA